jgi:hypothetical protein
LWTTCWLGNSISQLVNKSYMRPSSWLRWCTTTMPKEYLT